MNATTKLSAYGAALVLLVKRMHLIVVRRDTTGFQHMHPKMAPGGVWRVPLSLPAAGSYRAFADFTPPGSEGTTLGVDLVAPGRFEPVSHVPSRTAQLDGYTVDLAVPGLPARRGGAHHDHE